MSRIVRMALIALTALALACDGVESNSGATEALRVTGAFLHEGTLPGTPTEDLPEDLEEVLELTPRVPVISFPAGAIFPGRSGIALRGTATEDTHAIGVRLADVGSGYWVRAVGGPTGQPNELEWDARLDFSRDIAPGTHTLQIVAIDGEGNAGPHTTFKICVTREVEQSRNACDPTVAPPAAIISLRWESNADVDLVVITPSGKTVDANNPSTVDLEGGEKLDPEAPGVGLLSLDSNNGCRIDGKQRESLVFRGAPEPGEYLVYAKLFEPCGAGATPFKVEAYVRTRGEEPGSFGLGHIVEPRHGILLPQSASGDADLGLFVTTVEFP